MLKSMFTFKSRPECHKAIGLFLEDYVSGVVARKGKCTLALSGGRSPAALFQCLAEAPFKDTIPWKDVLFFWGDERCVSPDHQDSNFCMAMNNLLQPLSVDKKQIFRMPAEVRPYDEAARQYQETLRRMLPLLKGGNVKIADSQYTYPSFDLIILGMGEDGHTASLFPGHPVMCDTNLVAAIDSDMAVPPVPRLTLTLPVINNADTVLFMVHGKGKLELVESFDKDSDKAKIFPAALVRPKKRLHWYLAA